MAKITQTKGKRALFFKNPGGLPIFSGKFIPARDRMLEEVKCPCHQEIMFVKVSGGQLINLKKECKRQVELGVRWNRPNPLILTTLD